MSMKPYPEYKDSGVEWIDSYPKNWRAGRLSRMLLEIKDGTHGTFTRVDEGRELLSAKNVRSWGIEISESESLISEEDYLSIVSNGFPANGDVALTIVGTVGRSCVYRYEEPKAFQRSVCFLRPGSGMTPDFMNFQIQTNVFQEQLRLKTKVSAQPGVYMSDVSSISVVIPPLDEQCEIVRYLDRETAEIDAFIADQEELIELLSERRTATITGAVTKGLDPNAPMKDSGVAWIGKIPAEWYLTKLGHHFEVTLGKMLDGGKEAPADSQYLPYIRAANIQDDALDLRSVNKMPYSRAEAKRWNLLKGDLMVVEGGSVGTCTVLSEDMPQWSFQKTVNRVRPRDHASTSYLGYVIRSFRDAEVFNVICNGSTIAHLTAEKLQALHVPLPSGQESQNIVEYLDRETTEIDAAIDDAREAIALSKERRAAVISAAVTGKIDVRGLVDPATSGVEGASVGAA